MPEPLDLEPVKERLAAATQGPWRYDMCAVYSDETKEWVATDEHSPDADLIAHAPEDLAALIAEVERLRPSPPQQLVDTPGRIFDPPLTR